MSELKTFPFIHHTQETEYPERGSQVRLGGGWTHTEKPVGPPSRTITLNFAAMKYFIDAEGGLDATVNEAINLLALEKFYQEHEQHKHFIYNHYLHGLLTVVFKSPFKTPKLIAGGDGATQSFQVVLLEIPT